MAADEQPQRITQRGLYFDELQTGVVYQHTPGRTMTEADNTIFSTLTMNHQALHLDAAWSATNALGGERLMNSMHTLSTLIGLSVNQLTQSTIVAQLGFSEVSFPKPVFAGDTLYAETEVLEKRESKSRPGQGIVSMRHTGRNQDGDVVVVAVRSALFHLSPAAKDAADAGAADAGAADANRGQGQA